jgi:zinc transport system permease protein
MPHEETPTWQGFLDAWDLFRDAMLCAAFAGAVLGFLGVYVVLRRMVFVSAALTQSAGLGVALAFYAAIHLGFEVEPVWGAAGCALLATLALLGDPERVHLTREAVLGVVFAVSGGAAVLVGSRITQEAHDIQAILFGSAVLVRPFDLAAVEGVGGAILLVHLWWFRGLGFASFDPVAARVQELPVRFLQGVVLASIGAMVGVSARALGAMPVFALSTLPAMAALALGARLRTAFAAAALIGAISGFAGYLTAFFFDLPVGAAQTTLAAAFTAAAVLVRGAGTAVGRLAPR